MSENTLVLGLAAGYHYGDVRPFAKSLKQSGFAGRCVLFVSPTTRDADRMAAEGLEVVPFERPAEAEHIPYNAWRYSLYKDWLLQSGERFDRILITDVRDVIFQSAPMAFDWADGVNVTLEDKRMTIGQCPYMTRWVTGHLGKEAHAAIAQCPISCSGTTVADHDGMMDYLGRMLSHMAGFKPGKSMAGYDQGVHNHLLHNDMLPKVTKFDNRGPILTLAYKKGVPALGEDGLVLNDAGQPAVIVHQYDRKPEIFKMLRERYS